MIPRPRSLRNFLNDPSSLRYATAAIVSVTGILVVIGAVVIRLFDSKEYPTMGGALWFTVQTVTTVGYGDNAPVSWIGRAVATVVMLVSIGLITVVTALITSLFIQSAGRIGHAVNGEAPQESLDRIEATLARAHERLDQIERRLIPGYTDHEHDETPS